MLLNGLPWFDLSRRFVCLQDCLQLRDYTIHSEPRPVKEKPPLEDSDMLSELMSCRALSMYPFPSRVSYCWADTSLNFINTKRESVSLGIAVSPRSFICLSANLVSSVSFWWRVFLGASVFGLSHSLSLWEKSNDVFRFWTLRCVARHTTLVHVRKPQPFRLILAKFYPPSQLVLSVANGLGKTAQIW